MARHKNVSSDTVHYLVAPKQEPLPVFFADHQLLDRLHNETIALIEEADIYMQNDAPIIRRDFTAEISAFYMKQMHYLSTRLRQTAYLLMLSRAVREGDMQPQEAYREINKIILEPHPFAHTHPAWKHLPEAFCSLSRKSLALASCVFRLIQGNDQRQILKYPQDNQGFNMLHWQHQQLIKAFATNHQTQGTEKV